MKGVKEFKDAAERSKVLEGLSKIFVGKTTEEIESLISNKKSAKVAALYAKGKMRLLQESENFNKRQAVLQIKQDLREIFILEE